MGPDADQPWFGFSFRGMSVHCESLLVRFPLILVFLFSPIFSLTPLYYFNISVLATSPQMGDADQPWILVFPWHEHRVTTLATL